MMNDESAPPPDPVGPQAIAVGTRYRVVDLGEHLELRDRLFPNHVLGRFPPTTQGQASAEAELRRLGGEGLGPSAERPRRSGRRPWTPVLALPLAVLLAATLVPRLLPDGSRPLTNAEVLGRMERATLLVVTYIGESPLASGTAWIYDGERGLVVTNAHVVESGSSFHVGRRGESFAQASLLGTAPCYDLAVLKLSLPPEYEALELAPDDPSRTDRVAVMGYPLGAQGAPDQGQPRSAFGTVTDPDVRVTGLAIDHILHSAWLGPGDSGGPLVDMSGRLVGVNRAVVVGQRTTWLGQKLDAQIRNASLAVPVSDVREVIPELASGRNVC